MHATSAKTNRLPARERDLERNVVPARHKPGSKLSGYRKETAPVERPSKQAAAPKRI